VEEEASLPWFWFRRSGVVESGTPCESFAGSEEAEDIAGDDHRRWLR